MCLAWTLPGLVGHDPWKPDEAYGFGVIHHVLETGDWVVPTLAGEPFMEKPPLYWLTGAAFAKIASPPLSSHDAARLASGFYLLLAFLFAGLAGRRCWGEGGGTATVLLLVGAPALAIHTHMIITDAALFAGYAIAFYGLTLAPARPALGGAVLGTGVGVAFMAKGLLAPGQLGLAAVLLPVLSPSWRTRSFARTAGAAAVAALPWLVVWPVAVYLRSPALFREWLVVNNLGRFLGFAHLGPPNSPAFYLTLLPYFAFPALPLAAFALWRRRTTGGLDPMSQAFLVGFVAIVGVLAVASDGREVYALPALIPLSLLAAPSIQALPPKLSAGAIRGSVVLPGLLAALLWAGWGAMVTGRPGPLSDLFTRAYPAYVPAIRWGGFAAALAYTAGWLLLVARRGEGGKHALVNWAAGVTLAWGLAMTLWLPWLDAGKSYRPMVSSLVRAIPPGGYEVASRNLGEPQRALLDYYAGIETRRVETRGGDGCDLLLTQGDSRREEDPGPQWRKIWEGCRQGDAKERFRLYRRADQGAASPARIDTRAVPVATGSPVRRPLEEAERARRRPPVNRG